MKYRFLSAALPRVVILVTALAGAALVAMPGAAAPPSALQLGSNQLRLAQPNIARFPAVT